MRKRILTGIVSAGMAAVLLAGCGGSGSTTANTTATTAAATEATAATEAAAATETAAADSGAEASQAETGTDAVEAGSKGAGAGSGEAEAGAGGTLKVVATSEDYMQLFDKFAEETGIETELLSMSSGEVLSKVKAEGGTPMADLWFGGGIDSFMSAKEDGLLDQVNFDAAADLAPEYKDPDNYWFSKGMTIVGFIVNNDIMEEKGLEMPQTWDDLTDPAYKGEVLMSNPAISGTNYAVVNALLQTKGEEEGWKYFEALNQNIDYYSKRGKDPNVKTAAGEVGIGITYIDGTVLPLEEEQNVTFVYPTDGIPYIPDGVAVFKNASNGAAAKQFVEWFYSNDENLLLLARIDQKDTIKLVKPNLEGIELTFDTGTMMEEDLSLFGSKREEILEKWDVLAGDKAEAE